MIDREGFSGKNCQEWAQRLTCGYRKASPVPTALADSGNLIRTPNGNFQQAAPRDPTFWHGVHGNVSRWIGWLDGWMVRIHMQPFHN